jgi:hypothetical protein
MKGLAQKQTFDVISYTQPTGWELRQSDAGIQLSVKDKKTGGYAIAIITKSIASNATPNENFNNDWDRLVKSTVQANEAPQIQDPVAQNGWSIISGNANYTEGANKGIATLLTATGDSKMVSVVLLTNTQQFQTDLLAFLHSLDLPQSTANPTGNSPNNTQLTGIWGQYQGESYAGAGGSSNLTAGYDCREYYFNSDGSYEFLQKNVSYLYQNEIVFVYEKGTYKCSGNQLTISPQSGTVESWSKAGGDKAGKLLQTANRILETITYTIDFHYFPGIQKTNLVLQSNKPTLRDGPFSNNATFKNAWLYGRPFNPGKPSIELPVGTKINLTYKPATGGGKSPASQYRK